MIWRSISRRGFLRAMPAAPIVAKSAVTSLVTEAEALTGASVGVGRVVRDYPDYDISERLSDREQKHLTRLRGIFDFIKVNGIPDWKRKEIRINARMNRILDPDIASLRSVSMSGKLEMQWKRHEARYIAKEFEELALREQSSSWLKKFGVEYW